MHLEERLAAGVHFPLACQIQFSRGKGASNVLHLWMNVVYAFSKRGQFEEYFHKLNERAAQGRALAAAGEKKVQKWKPAVAQNNSKKRVES